MIEEKKTIIIAPFAARLRSGSKNPKNYPFWKEVVSNLKKHNFHIIQIGSIGEETIGADETKFGLTFYDLKKLVQECHLWISIDSFLGHLGALINKKGIVIWGVSDPELFGYESNINLIKDRKYLRPNQFDIWDTYPYKDEVFVHPDVVLDAVLSYSDNEAEFNGNLS